jgi:hypothetical protein
VPWRRERCNISATVFVQAHYGHRDFGPPELRRVDQTEKADLLSADLRNCMTNFTNAPQP